MGWAWLLILWAIGIMLLVVLLQMKTRHLIQALRTDEGLYQQAGRPSCDYFWVSLWQWRNHDLLYWIARHASLPPHLAQDVPDYHDIRRLCRVYLWLERTALLAIVAYCLVQLGLALVALLAGR